ncbi:hypothetical protein QF038_001974 [Pseudarthrobacter sp. W1I19]|uniref:helicase associated domain-containing protein n=1 Tax=Pseudarthrobacter sp. W1I19 TaxID=3042288 RepID=UPI0027832A21|nr:helicase associated domain-containing protein [Pseudarthrobacter sp. W1I19]MDQ0923466.1 hypothetical protein [Pseudarthrobacter sp. W1I19]
MDQLPGWRRSARAHEEAQRWNSRLTEVAALFAIAQRLPSLHEPQDETERVLSAWIHSQRQGLKAGSLSKDKVALLDELVPERRKDQRRREAMAQREWRPQG